MITAAAAGDWAAADRHHLAAIHQTDTAPYVHLQPVSREWHARMLLHHNRAQDQKRARTLLQESIRMYESTGMPERSRHARQLLAKF